MRHRAGSVLLLLAALGAATMHAASGPAAPAAPDAAAAKVVKAARQQVGDRYRYGGNGLDAWDCSGLTSRMWREIGGVAGIPRTSRDQQRWAWPIRPQDARPGDLVFFDDPVTHVGIYLGDGRMVDASSSRKSVVERAVWTSAVVRYGRVPRPGVTKPKPPAAKPAPARKPEPTPTAKPAPATKPAPKPAPTSKPTTKPTGKPAPKATMRPVPPPGHQPKAPTSRQMATFVDLATSRKDAAWQAQGSGPKFDAAGLVRWAWAKAGYGTLPSTPAAIEARTTPVRLADLAVGDLVLYGKPAVHVGVYVGGGRMVDASKVLRKVVIRSVFASETVRFARLKAPR